MGPDWKVVIVVDTHGEDKHTRPRPFCPHPENWTAHDGSAAEVEVSEFIGALVRLAQPELVFESGTCWGHTSEIIGRALQANGHGRLVTTEINHERVLVAQNRCDGLPVQVLEMSSMDWMPDEPLGFVFFDGFMDNRILEYERFRPYFDESTVLVFHDTAPHKRQILTGREGELNMVRLHTPRGLTVAQIRQPVAKTYREMGRGAR